MAIRRMVRSCGTTTDATDGVSGLTASDTLFPMAVDGGGQDLDRAVTLIRALQDLRTDEPEVVRVRQRLAALATDFGFAFVSFFAVAVLVGLIIGATWGFPNTDGEEGSPPDPRTIAVLVASFAAWLALIAFQNLTGVHGSGRSLGKESLDLRLVRSDLTSVSIQRRLGRWATAMAIVLTPSASFALLAPYLDSALSFSLLVSGAVAVVVLLVGRGPRGIHDLMWDTKVISPRPAATSGATRPLG